MLPITYSEPSRLYTINDIAALHGGKPASIRKALKARKIQPKKETGHKLYPASALEALLEEDPEKVRRTLERRRSNAATGREAIRQNRLRRKHADNNPSEGTSAEPNQPGTLDGSSNS
jgi:hypothetical protein